MNIHISAMIEWSFWLSCDRQRSMFSKGRRRHSRVEMSRENFDAIICSMAKNSKLPVICGKCGWTLYHSTSFITSALSNCGNLAYWSSHLAISSGIFTHKQFLIFPTNTEMNIAPFDSNRVARLWVNDWSARRTNINCETIRRFSRTIIYRSHSKSDGEKITGESNKH